MTVIVGRPVEVGPPNTEPSAAEVQAVFERYLDEVGRIFSTHAAYYLPPSVAKQGLRVQWIGHGPVRHVLPATS